MPTQRDPIHPGPLHPDPSRPRRSAPAALLLAALSAGCMSLDYDLSSVPVPVDAKPADPATAAVEPFRVEAHQWLWVHGLLGRSDPDVASLVAGEVRGSERLAGLRVQQRSGFHEWLVTHLSLTLVRAKTVVIEGQRVRAR